jgi:hypothetical protein
MKKILLITCCLVLVFFVLPGGLASWGLDLKIIGGVGTGQWSEQESVINAKGNENRDGDAGDQEKPEIAASEHLLTVKVKGRGITNLPPGDYTIKSGDPVKLSAGQDPEWPGYRFVKWIINGAEEFSADINISVLKDTTATAVFAELIEDQGKQENSGNEGDGDERSDPEIASGGESEEAGEETE